MKGTRAVRWGVGALIVLGIGIAMLALPTSAHAGGVHLSIGFGIPYPVYVVPGPVVVAPPPVVVYPAPVVRYQSPVVIAPPYAGYPRHYGYPRYYHPGWAKRHYGHHPAYGYKYYKPWRHGWKDDD